MAEFSLPYGRGDLSVSLPDEWQVELIAPKQVPALPNPSAAVSRVLDNPIGGRRLFDFAGTRSAAIAINDILQAGSTIWITRSKRAFLKSNCGIKADLYPKR